MESRFARVDDDDDDDIFIMSDSTKKKEQKAPVKTETPIDVRSTTRPQNPRGPQNVDPRNLFGTAGVSRGPLLPTPHSSFNPGPMNFFNEGPPPGQWVGLHPPPQQQANLSSFHQQFAKAPFRSQRDQSVYGPEQPPSHSLIGKPVLYDRRPSTFSQAQITASSNVMTSKESQDVTSPPTRKSNLTQIRTEPEKLRALVDTLFMRQPSLASTSIADSAPRSGSSKDSTPPGENDTMEKFIANMKPVIESMRKECKDLRFKPAQDEMTLDEYYAVLPPIETFMEVSREARCAAFYKQIQVDDLLIGEIERKTETGFVLEALCTDAGKRRDLTELEIKLHCPYTSSLSEDRHVKIPDSYQFKDLIRVRVVDKMPISGKILVSMKSDSLSKEIRDNFKLGLMSEDDLPVHYKRIKMIDGASYHEVLKSILTFNNPAATDYLLQDIVQPPEGRHMSLIEKFRNKTYDIKDMAASLKKTQSARWASKSVQLGVQLLKQGKTLEAHQAVAKALQIDPENVDALVTRGCLHANSNNLRKGLDDFEKALSYNPNHSNAKKYCAETMVAIGTELQNEGNYSDAEKMYKKAVKMDGRNTEGKEKLEKLVDLMKHKNSSPSKKPSLAMSQPQRPISSTSYQASSNPERPDSLTETQEKLLSLIKSESSGSSKKNKKKKKEKKKNKSSKKRKKHRRDSSSSDSSVVSTDSSSGSSSDDSNSTTDSEKKSKKSKRKAKKKSKRLDTPIDLSPSPGKKDIEPLREPLATRNIMPMAGLVPLFDPMAGRASDHYALDHALSSNRSITPAVEQVLRERREEEILRPISPGGIPGLDYLGSRRPISRSPPPSRGPRYSDSDFRGREHSNFGNSSGEYSRGYSSSGYPSGSYTSRGRDFSSRGGYRGRGDGRRSYRPRSRSPPPRRRSRSPISDTSSHRRLDGDRRSRSRTPPRIIDHRRSDDRFADPRRERGGRRSRYSSYSREAIAERDRQELGDLTAILGSFSR